MSTHRWVDKKVLLDRTKKVEGQATAVRRMLANDSACGEILQQVAALNSATQRLAVLLLLEDHIEVRCGASGGRGRRGPATLLSPPGPKNLESTDVHGSPMGRGWTRAF